MYTIFTLCRQMLSRLKGKPLKVSPYFLNLWALTSDPHAATEPARLAWPDPGVVTRQVKTEAKQL